MNMLHRFLWRVVGAEEVVLYWESQNYHLEIELQKARLDLADLRAKEDSRARRDVSRAQLQYELL